MRRRLDTPIPALRWPDGVQLRTWRDDDAPAVHALLASAYALGGGRVASYEIWRRSFTTDAEHDPESCFLAFHHQRLAGVALCWSSAFIKDLCVAAPYRRRGLGAALVGHALQHFAARGERVVTLKVEADNPSGAQRLYERLGFEQEAECWITRLEHG
jgi:ribosomal protein S18 acetylase RimI-like enzyme